MKIFKKAKLNLYTCKNKVVEPSMKTQSLINSITLSRNSLKSSQGFGIPTYKVTEDLLMIKNVETRKLIPRVFPPILLPTTSAY